jgi:ribonucleotide monophosphatase NagD (HAD superfamily)
VIGDGIMTDMAGAQAQQLDALFVATGIHRQEASDIDGALSAGRIDALLAQAGLRAEFATGDLAW